MSLTVEILEQENALLGRRRFSAFVRVTKCYPDGNCIPHGDHYGFWLGRRIGGIIYVERQLIMPGDDRFHIPALEMEIFSVSEPIIQKCSVCLDSQLTTGGWCYRCRRIVGQDNRCYECGDPYGHALICKLYT